MEALRALMGKRERLVLGMDEAGNEVALTLRGLTVADVCTMAEEYERLGVSVEEVKGTGVGQFVARQIDAAVYTVWLMAHKEHPDLTVDDLREYMPVEALGRVQEVLAAISPTPGEQDSRGAITCPACEHRFPFVRDADGVRVAEDVANYQPPGGETP
jgi:hypothetical protein